MKNTISIENICENTGYVELKIFNKKYAFLFDLKSVDLFLNAIGISEDDFDQPMLEKLLKEKLHIYMWAAAEIASIWKKKKDNKITVEKIKSWLDSSPPKKELLKLANALINGGKQTGMAGNLAIDNKN